MYYKIYQIYSKNMSEKGFVWGSKEKAKKFEWEYDVYGNFFLLSIYRPENII